MQVSIFIIIVSIIALLYFYFHNENRRIERYYFYNNKYLFALLAFANFILIISAVMNFKFIFYELWSIYTNILRSK